MLTPSTTVEIKRVYQTFPKPKSTTSSTTVEIKRVYQTPMIHNTHFTQSTTVETKRVYQTTSPAGPQLSYLQQ